jgi:hypothetical protein
MLSIRATNCAKEATDALQYIVKDMYGSICDLANVHLDSQAMVHHTVLHCECEYRQVRSATRRLPICLWYRSLFVLGQTF